MTEHVQRAAGGETPERKISSERDSGLGPGRTALYALFSDLAASPFDSEPVIAAEAIELTEMGLPYDMAALSAPVAEWRESDREELKRTYSSLFEVGGDGPPVPIREDLHRSQPAGVRQDIVRFYEFFGYELSESFAWAPDHLSVEFEFMHYLCYMEAEALRQEDADSAKSFQLAQFDFAQRHLVDWVPELAERIHENSSDSLYARVFVAIANCLTADFQWQASTIIQEA